MRTAIFLVSLGLLGCGATLSNGAPRAHQSLHVGDAQEGLATWYSDSLAGNTTANGEVYAPERMTAAHRTLPFGTRVRVRRSDTGREVVVRINDRGPYASPRRIIDVSRAAAEALQMIRAGVVPVVVEVLEVPRPRSRRRSERKSD